MISEAINPTITDNKWGEIKVLCPNCHKSLPWMFSSSKETGKPSRPISLEDKCPDCGQLIRDWSRD